MFAKIEEEKKWGYLQNVCTKQLKFLLEFYTLSESYFQLGENPWKNRFCIVNLSFVMKTVVRLPEHAQV